MSNCWRYSSFAAVLDFGEPIDARVVHQHIQPTEVVERRLDQRLDLGLLAHIGLHRHRAPTRGLDVGDDLLRAMPVGGVVDDDLRAVGRKPARDARADAFRSARHQGDLAVQSAHVH